MKKPIAYIISAYKDAPHLARLVKALDYNADFYVHIDEKADATQFEQLLNGKVVFIKRHWISWGGWSQVEFQKELLGAVINSQKEYSRVVCLSGQDYPLWSNEKIHRFFEENPDKEFVMGFNVTTSTNPAQRAKIVNYHFFRDLKWRSNWWKNKFIVVARNIMKVLPIKKEATTRIDNKDVEVFGGSDYWAMTYSCARYVYNKLCSEQEMMRYFKNSFVPSELCIQTIVFNSPYAKQALLYKGEYPGLSNLTPLHYIDYKKAIKVFSLPDMEVLQQSNKMFARKLEWGISDSLIKAIDAEKAKHNLYE